MKSQELITHRLSLFLASLSACVCVMANLFLSPNIVEGALCGQKGGAVYVAMCVKIDVLAIAELQS